jgi:23S rRNA (pseudouridine1915-N3)-methyltransferase
MFRYIVCDASFAVRKVCPPMHIIAVGRLRNCPEADLFDRYKTRLRPQPTVVEVAEARGGPVVVKRQEAAALLGALPRNAFAVPLDLGGSAVDSQDLAEKLQRWSEFARPICFLIGGAEGFDQAVIERADFVMSFGMLTWPHFLVRAMLAEQLYRAQAIALGHPYHRAGRPDAVL